MTDYVVRDTQLTSVADAIRTKGGTSDPLAFPDGFVSAVEAIPTGGGGGSVPAKEVNFRDYDGTVLYSYTPTEFAALSAMPDNPDHSSDEIPLTAQGWNWSFADAQAYVAKYGRLEVGQTYITTDGKTHIKIYIDPDTPANRMTFYLRWTQSVSNGVTVDWGDGSATQTYSGTEAEIHGHTYAAGGWYDITLTVTSGTVSFAGSSGKTGNSICGSNEISNTYNRYRIRGVRLGGGLAADAVGTYCFYQCRQLSVISIPYAITSIGDYAFYYCSTLANIIIPNSVIRIDAYAFYQCTSISNIDIPNSVTSIEANAFNICSCKHNILIPDSITYIKSNVYASCPNVVSIIIPDSVTHIATSAFSNEYSCGALYFFAIKPPTVDSTSAFTNLPTDCKIYVPTGSLSAYTSATNYPSSSTYTYIEE